MEAMSLHMISTSILVLDKLSIKREKPYLAILSLCWTVFLKVEMNFRPFLTQGYLVRIAAESTTY